MPEDGDKNTERDESAWCKYHKQCGLVESRYYSVAEDRTISQKFADASDESQCHCETQSYADAVKHIVYEII